MRERLVRAAELASQAIAPRWRLPFRLAVLRALNALEPELAHLDEVAGWGRVAVDAGANVGLYSLPLAARFDRVLAFEPNATLVSDLVAANPGTIEIHTVGLSDRRAQTTLYVPVRGQVVLSGWGSLNPNNLPDRTAVRLVAVEVTTLDSFGLDCVDFLKIDVEGHEAEVLGGAHETIARCRPRILIEVKPGNEARVRDILSTLGYSERRLRELAGVPGSPENAIYVPVVPLRDHLRA